jgi:hypothetical protein
MTHKRYTNLVLFFGFIVFGLTLPLYVWSMFIGEGSAQVIVNKQKLNKKSLYLSGIKDNNIGYKLEIYNQLNPDIVALGSSRSMQVRAKYFKTKFTNLGGLVNSIAELDYVSSQIIKLERKPSIVLLFADIWWFNEKFQNPRLRYAPSNQSDYLTLANIDLLSKPIIKNGIILSKDNRLGFGAVYQNQGFDSSGSFHYVSTITGETTSNDFKFQDTFNRIDNGINRFEYSDIHSADGVQRFKKIIEQLENEKIHVVVVMPPFANAVYQKMLLSKKYSYISSLTKDLNNTHAVFDFTNPNDIRGANDCEFIDGFHGGETIYARILLQISARDKLVNDTIDFAYISRVLSKYEGKSSPETIATYGSGKPEVDFLGLKCSK